MGASASSAAEVRGWTADDVAARVAGFGAAFSKYAEVAKENGLDGSTLLMLDPDSLKEQVQELMGAEAKSFHLMRLSVELCKLKESLAADLREEQQAKERERQRQEQEAKAKEDGELSKVGGLMVEWLVSINVEERMARKYAAAMKEHDFTHPSQLVRLSEKELMEKFGVKEGSAIKMREALDNPASLPPKTPATASTQAPPNATAAAKQPADTTQMSVRWQWCADNGYYMSYERGTILQIEEAWKQKRATVSISSSGKEYVIDLGSMKQKPVVNAEASGGGAGRAGAASSSGGGSDGDGARKIRRWTKEENHPPSWDHMPADKDWTVENVERGTADWVRAENAMFAHDGFSGTTRELLKVERIQNRTLLKRYRAEREIITSRRGATNLNERYLFHGTSATAPLAIATSPDGFVVEAGRSDAFYGKGSYLAEKARYSHHYAHQLLSTDKKQRHRQLLLVSVVCGVSKEYANSAIDRGMGQIALSQQGFDSVLGGPHRPRLSGPGDDDSRMCVVYKSQQTMPEFVLTYRADEDNNKGSGSGNDGGGSGAGMVAAAAVTAAAPPAPAAGAAFTLSGLPAGHARADCMGAYTMQGRTSDGRPTYKGGRDDDMWAWYHAGRGKWFVGPEFGVGTSGGAMCVEDSNAATPDAATATWQVAEGWKRNISLTVTASAGGNGIRIAGLAAGHYSAPFMGEYTRQAGLEGGKAWYKGGRDGDRAAWYHAGEGTWVVGPASWVGTTTAAILAESTAATPDAVQAGTWHANEGWQPNSAVRCTSSAAAAPAAALVAGAAFTLSGLPAGHERAYCMGAYTMQGRTNDGRPTYKGGRDGGMWAWYYPGYWFVGSEDAVGMCVEGRNAATPDAATATWLVVEGFKRNSSLTVTASAGGDGIRIAGLAAGHYSARFMGEYTRQAGLEGGKAWYKGGRDGDRAVWYHAGKGKWYVGLARDIGTKKIASILAESTAATPDAVQAGTWETGERMQPNSAVRCVRA